MKNQKQTGAAVSAQPAPELWRVMACPKHAGKHPFHDHRWIVTADAEIEWNHDRSEWSLSRGALVAEMRDGPTGRAHLAAAAPALLAALKKAQAALLRELGHYPIGTLEFSLMGNLTREIAAEIEKAE